MRFMDATKVPGPAALATYRKKPVEIQALQLRWDTWNEMCSFAEPGFGANKPVGVYVLPDGRYTNKFPGDDARIGMLIPTLEGEMLAIEGDYVIRGVKGELYPCKPDIFAATYEAV